MLMKSSGPDSLWLFVSGTGSPQLGFPYRMGSMLPAFLYFPGSVHSKKQK